METITFTTSAMFLGWVQLIVDGKVPHYDRTPVPIQAWIYGDGHVEETGYGKRGGTLLTNLEFIIKTGSGQLEHPKERELVQDIDKRGGVAIIIRWPEATGADL